MHPRRKQDPAKPRPQTGVRWWVLALPVAAFAALLALVASPAGAQEHPVEKDHRHPVLEQVQRLLPDALVDFFTD